MYQRHTGVLKNTKRLTADARLVEQIVNEYLDKKKLTENQGESH